MSAKRRVTGPSAAAEAPAAGTRYPSMGEGPNAPLRPHRGAPSPGLAALRRRAVAELRAVLAHWLGLPADVAGTG